VSREVFGRDVLEVRLHKQEQRSLRPFPRESYLSVTARASTTTGNK